MNKHVATVWLADKKIARAERAIFLSLARPERFELPTPWFVARYSIQLSYGRVIESGAF
jgi:hypothetical protein